MMREEIDDVAAMYVQMLHMKPVPFSPHYDLMKHCKRVISVQYEKNKREKHLEWGS